MNLFGIESDRMAQLMYGQHAKHVPSWMYVQHQGRDVVLFVGASRVDGSGEAHPLRYGSTRTHQFVLGELIVRPHVVIGTDAYTGHGASGLLTNDHDPDVMLRKGELILDQFGMLPAADKEMRDGTA